MRSGVNVGKKMNKIQIRAEILTLITKLQTTTAVSDEMFALLDAEPDKQSIMDVLLKELARAKELERQAIENNRRAM